MTLSAFSPGAHDDDAADRVSLAVEVGDSAPHLGAERDGGDVLHRDRGPALRAEDQLLQISDPLHVATAAHHVLAPAELDQPPADVVVPASYGVDDHVERQLVGRERVRVHVDLVLPDLAADRGHLRHAGDRLDRVAEVPVLEGAQLVRRVLSRPIHERVLVDPADARRVGSQLDLHVLGKLRRDLGEVLEHARARPVQVGPVLEDHVDVAEPEVREPTDRLHLRRAEERGDDGIADLILDDVGAAVPPRVDDHLRVGHVGERVQGDVVHRPVRPDERDDRGRDDEVLVLRREADDGLDHGVLPSVASVRVRARCVAAARGCARSRLGAPRLTGTGPGSRQRGE